MASDREKFTDMAMTSVRFAKEEQKRRQASPLVARGDEAARQLEQHFHAYLIDPRLGFNIHTCRLWIFRLDPGEEGGNKWKTLGHRHTVEAVIHVLQGSGYSIIDGVPYDWQAGDFINVPIFAWHRHINPGPEPVLYVACTTGPFQMATGMAVYEDERFPELWVYAQQSESARKSLVPGGAADASPDADNGREHGTATLYGKLYQDQLQFAANEERLRRASRVLVRASEVQFQSTPLGDLAYLVDSRLGFHVRSLASLVARIPSGKRSGAHRHLYEEVNYILAGGGNTVIEDQTYEWKQGDALLIPVNAWHQHFNTGSDEVRILSHSTRPAMENLGLASTQQGEAADY